MTLHALMERAEKSIADKTPLMISAEELREITPEQAEILRDKFVSRLLLHMPEHEVAFQEWLKINALDVWKDLWDNVEDPPYTISLAFLTDMIGDSGEGAFYICDLQNVDNYFFTPDMLLEKVITFLPSKRLQWKYLLVQQISGTSLIGEVWSLSVPRKL